jgi:poly-gamma-glutamate capsule biosynthesis protein CapA/YwtB (metallophosphatase superfamily)
MEREMKGSLVCAALLSFAVGCAASGGGEAPAEPLPAHTLIYGGDVTLGRGFNHALHDEKARGKVFGDIAGRLAGADIALVNAEGVSASGGYFSDKGEPRPYMFRAHPRAVEMLAAAGIDMVTVGNNHAGDYGPEAFVEMLDRLLLAGVGYAGGGYDLEDARRPSYHRAGDAVVAVVGVDLTVSRTQAATKEKAGPLFFDAFRTDRNEDRIVKELTRALKEARRHAHVVLLSPHWGDNWKDAPTPELRRLAKRLVRAGYDGIIGHSSHWYHGVELIDGKPVIYDAGNLIVDYGGGDRAHRAFLWELTFTRAGVTGIAGTPLWLGRNTVNAAQGKRRDELIEGVIDGSLALGTRLVARGGVVELACDPGPIAGPKEAVDPPKRPAPATARLAPDQPVMESLPKTAVPVNVAFPGGPVLVGYELIASELTVPKAGQIVGLYWRTDTPVTRPFEVHVEGRGKTPGGAIGKSIDTHLPADWLLPADEWPVGKIVQDWTLLRLKQAPDGEAEFFAGLHDGGLVEPTSSDVPLDGGRLVPIGSAVFRKGARRLLDIWEDYLEARAVTRP